MPGCAWGCFLSVLGGREGVGEMGKFEEWVWKLLEIRGKWEFFGG